MKNLLILSVLIFCWVTVYGQKNLPESNRAAQPVIIDGILSEWPLPLDIADKGKKIRYSVSNDDTNLYLCLQTFDPSIQQKITRSGMTVQLSCSGKNKRNATISFPLKSQLMLNIQADRRPSPQDLQQGQRGGRAEMRQAVIERCTDMRVKGLASLDGMVPIKNDFGVCAAFCWEAELLLSYELAIPYAEFFGGDFTEADLETPVDIKITIMAMPQPSSGGAGGSPSGGGGGSRGGGGGMPRGGEGGADLSDMFTSTVIKHTLTLNRGN